MKKLKKWLSLALALSCVLSASAFFACNEGTVDKKTSDSVEENSEQTSEKEEDKFPEGTEGLGYRRLAGKEEYSVIGIGTATEIDIVIPRTYNGMPVTEIAESAFKDCHYLTSVVIGCNTIGTEAFRNCDGLTKVTFSNSVMTIGNQAFRSCNQLVDVDFGLGVSSIGDEAFMFCGMEKVEIPDSMTTIGASAFESCESLTRVIMGNGVTSIGMNAFDECKALHDVFIKDIASWCNISFATFASNPAYNRATLHNGSSVVKELVIPETVRIIKDCAFLGFVGLTSVVIPNNVISIGDHAFYCCDSLTSIAFENTSNWYAVGYYDWIKLNGYINGDSVDLNDIEGAPMDLSDFSTNATYFKATYPEVCWFNMSMFID